MRIATQTLALFGLAISVLTGPAAASSNLTETVVTPAASSLERPAIHWHKSLATARADAARTGKPLLLLHLFGKLDEPFC